VVDPGTGEDIVTVGARSADEPIAAVRCEHQEPNRVVLRADAPVSVSRSAAGAGLEAGAAAFAAGFAAASGVAPIRPPPTTWCSWYQYFTEVSQADVLENLDAIRTSELPVDVVQLDDGYQSEIGDWLSLSRRFASLEGMVDRIRATGPRAGIWIAPFLVGARSRLGRDHPDWLVRAASGAPVLALHNWGQDVHVLDVTHPGAQEHLAGVLATMRQVGSDFFKIDFLYAAALDGLRHDPSLTSTQAYRRELDQVRAAIGPEAYLLGCGAPLLPSVGKVDAMRVSADTAPAWAAEHGDRSLPGGESAELSVRGRAYQHGRYWVNDPDCLLLRPGVDQRERRARLVERYGGLRGSSDRIAALDEWGLRTTTDLLSSVPPPTPFPIG